MFNYMSLKWTAMNMTEKIKGKFKLIFDVRGTPLTFTGTNITKDDNFINFIDKYGNQITYRLEFLERMEQIEEVED